MSSRKFNLYFRNNGGDFIKFLHSKKAFTLTDISSWFKIPKISEDERETSVKRIIEKLIHGNILQYNAHNDSYMLTNKALRGFIKLMNMGQIRYGDLNCFKREIFHPTSFYDFLDPFGNKKRFYLRVSNLINLNLEQMNFWKSLDYYFGQILCYIRAFYYYQLIISSKVQIDYYDPNKIIDILNSNESLRNTITYKEVNNHFTKCHKKICSKCGTNLINQLKYQVELIKEDIRNRQGFPDLLQKIKDIPYYKGDKLKLIDELTIQLKRIIPTDENMLGKDVNNTVEIILKQQLQEAILEMSYINYKIKKEFGKFQRLWTKLDYSRLNYWIEQYIEEKTKLMSIISPNPIIKGLDGRLGMHFIFDKKGFQIYSNSVRSLGREGEKRVAKELQEQFPNSIVDWKNEKKESGLPYDIYIKYKGGREEYIEVKTTHTNKRQFEMSEKEFRFALQNSSNYRLYLIVNLGAGANTYHEVIQDFRAYFNKYREPLKNLEIISRNFKLN